MTRGALVVSEDDANRVLQAVEKHELHVLVSADTMGDGLYTNPVRIIVSHVIAVIENPHDDVQPAMPGDGKRRLRAVRGASEPT